MLTFTTTMKLLKLLKFNRKMSMLGDVLRYSAWFLFNFSIVFLIMFFAYVQMAYLFFGRDVFDFKSVLNVIETLFVMLLSKYALVLEAGQLSPGNAPSTIATTGVLWRFIEPDATKRFHNEPQGTKHHA
jgi:hypothetical protein